MDTTNSRGIKNIVNYLQGSRMKGMKALSFRLWSIALSKQYNIKKHLKINRILHKTENNLSYPFTLSKKFSTQATFSMVPRIHELAPTNVQLNPFYITGFVDGEGSFMVALYKRPARDSKIGWGVRAQFQIVLHARDLPLLKKIQTFFGGIGSISESKVRNTVSFCVASIKEINEVIIPHFDNYKLLTQKQVDFELFKSAVGLINKGEHLTVEGLIKIAGFKASINTGSISKEFPFDVVPVIRPQAVHQLIADSY